MTLLADFDLFTFEDDHSLKAQFAALLQKIRPGKMSNTAYDTSWLARLHNVPELAPLANDALNWLRDNQLEDGSWGAETPLYHHDRVVCTLGAVLALNENGDEQDHHRIKAGIRAIQHHQARLDLDLAGETVAFGMITPTLFIEAVRRGLLTKKKSTAQLRRLATEREGKLAKVPGNMINRFVTMAHSAEMAGSDGMHILDVENLQESDGSIGTSPSATAYFLKHLRPQNKAAIAYLQRSTADAGLPNVAPFDVFEAAWTLWNLSVTEEIDDALLALCEPHLDFLEREWDAETGIGFASPYTSNDGDDTGFVFEVLTRFGRRPNVAPIFHYETDTHFRCFALESNPSISTNIHIFGALRHNGYSIRHLPVQKVLRFLQRNQHSDGYWIDKWHISPYYPTSHMIVNCIGYADQAAKDAINWLLNSQREDGSWGVLGGTPEETAYALQALAVCWFEGVDIPVQSLMAGRNWLLKNQNSHNPPLWIGKCLYTPYLVVQSTIISALMLCNQVIE